MIKVIIFDYYGVIAQDAFWYEVKGIEAGKHKSEYIQKLSDEVNVDKISWQEFCEAVARDLGLSIEVVRERYADHKIKPGIVELIGTLRQKYRIVLLSNASAEQLVPVMQHLGLDKLFERIFVSSSLRLMKPDPEVYLAATRELGVTPQECVMIDDAKRNIEAAVALGMRGITFEDSESCSRELKAHLGPEQIA